MYVTDQLRRYNSQRINSLCIWNSSDSKWDWNPFFIVQKLNENFAKMNKMFAKKVENFDREYIKICKNLDKFYNIYN